MLDVESAQARLLALAKALPAETAPLAQSLGRLLAAPVYALTSHPPLAVSAMDGYALRFADLAAPLRVIGESAAGHRFAGRLQPGEAVRIFTGAAVPPGADTILVQEEAARDGDRLRLAGAGPAAPGAHIRPAGLDFKAGDALIAAGTWLEPRLLGLAAAGGHDLLTVAPAPRVLLFATGDELTPAGAPLGTDRIADSNTPLLAALFRAAGAVVTTPGIVPDRPEALAAVLAGAAEHDVVVSVGGASVGDHDLVRPALIAAGATIDFWKIAMRPGKPLMVGRLGAAIVCGLPGNPVSAYVCARLFVAPLLAALQGDPAPLPTFEPAIAASDLPAGKERAEFLRARIRRQGAATCVDPFAEQDSAMLGVLARADALIRRDIGARPVPAGGLVEILRL